jgi:type IV pilus assembly protein PilX
MKNRIKFVLHTVTPIRVVKKHERCINTRLDVVPLLYNAQSQTGIALVTAMLILVMLTLLSVAMFRGFGLQAKIAGNVREKERAFHAAENALQYAEEWLIAGKRGMGGACTSGSSIASVADFRVCTAALTTESDPSTWIGASSYTPSAMIIQSGGGTAVDGNKNADINYSASPQLYIHYLGSPTTPANKCIIFYSVTAAGYGGVSQTTAVVQSIVKRSELGGCTP